MFRRRTTEVEDAPATRTHADPVIAGAGQSMLFTFIGAAGMIASAFLEWMRPEGFRGTHIGNTAFYRTTFSTDATFFRSAGAAVILIGLLAILGLASRAGWITRLAGALGIVGFALFTITLYRMDISVPTALGAGPWFLLGGGIVAMFGGFFATRPRMIVTNA